MAEIIIVKGREASVLRRHPWIFSGAVDRLRGIAGSGDTVDVLSWQERLLGRAAFSPHSQIRARMFTFDDSPVDENLFLSRISASLNRRLDSGLERTSEAYRIVFSESDGLPGLIMDRYGSFIVCQFLSAGAERWKDVIIRLLDVTFHPEGIYERSDTEVRRLEGLEPQKGLLCGTEPPQKLEIREGELRYLVDIRNGHKTGMYLDQRVNRGILAQYCVDKEVLNCFSYTGGFGLAALKGGARKVVNIDTSAECLALARENATLNGFDSEASEFIEGDVFKWLRSYRDAGRLFDLIVLDPPRFAESRSQLEGALRGYKDINLLAMKLLRHGGLLFTFSCSGHVIPELFYKMVTAAASDAGRRIQVLQHLQQASDHPVMLDFPEGAYLKGLICQAM